MIWPDVTITYRPPFGEESGGVAPILRSVIPEGTTVVAVGGKPGATTRTTQPGNRVQVEVGVELADVHYNAVNIGLWPGNHRMTERIGKPPKKWLQARGQVAHALASTAADISDDDIFADVHDYQNSAVGRELSKGWVTSYFHHTPVFDLQTYYDVARFPQGEELQHMLRLHLEDFLNFDVAVFQTKREVETIYENAEALLGATIEQAHMASAITYNGRTTFVDSVPIGLDTDSIDALFEQGVTPEPFTIKPFAGKTLADIVREGKAHGRTEFIKAGRADYTKNWLGNADFSYWFAQQLAQAGKTPHFTYVVKPTRKGVEGYDGEMPAIRQCVSSLNERWRETHDYDLFTLIPQGAKRESLFDAFQYVDGAIDISKMDGFHLVPFEAGYILSRSGRGFVVCSADAGAGITALENSMGHGSHGMLTVREISREEARKAASLYLAGSNGHYRTDDKLAEFIRDYNTQNWVHERQNLALMAKSLR